MLQIQRSCCPHEVATSALAMRSHLAMWAWRCGSAVAGAPCSNIPATSGVDVAVRQACVGAPPSSTMAHAAHATACARQLSGASACTGPGSALTTPMQQGSRLLQRLQHTLQHHQAQLQLHALPQRLQQQWTRHLRASLSPSQPASIPPGSRFFGMGSCPQLHMGFNSVPSSSRAGAWHSLGAARSYASEAREAAKSSRAAKPPASAAELGLFWGSAAVAMVGLSYAMVPLYKIFCAATGYGGNLGGIETVEAKLRRRQQQPDSKVEQAAADREVTVWFNADVAEDMPWEFIPTQEYVRVRPGQSTLVFFTARNKTAQPVTGYSVYNVTPDKSAIYFNKIQCFCFEMQRLRANEEIDMPVFFYIDPEFATDWNCRNVNDITLSYMFHKVDDEDLDEEDLADDGPTMVKLHGPGMGALPPGMAGLGPRPVAVAAGGSG